MGGGLREGGSPSPQETKELIRFGLALCQFDRFHLKSIQNASLMFNVHVSDAEALAIAQAIICLSRRVSAQNVNKFTNGQRCFIPRLLTLNGNSGWVSTVKRLSPKNSASILWCLAPLCVGISQNVAFYKCKHCDRVEPSSCAKFQYADLDCSLKCPTRKCNKLTKVGD